MKDVTNERWIQVVPATPLTILLAASIAAYCLKWSEDWQIWPMLILSAAFPLAPFVGIGVLASLCWLWLKERVELRRPRVLAGIAMSLLDILIPLGLLLYVLHGLSKGGLSF